LIVFLFILAGAVLVPMRTQTVLDPVSGIWMGDWGPTPSRRHSVTVSLRWDGTLLTGVVNPGPRALEFTKTSFDIRSGAVHLELKTLSGGREVHYVIDGRMERRTLIGTWYNEDNKGNVRLIKQ
jgi:hypothetical protein